jgi:heme-degrading monooxygenase HmoA
MIARRWHGRVPAEKAEEYLKLTKDVGLADYCRTPGDIAAWCLHRSEGDLVHVETFTLWESEEAIRRFAGQELAEQAFSWALSPFVRARPFVPSLEARDSHLTSRAL